MATSRGHGAPKGLYIGTGAAYGLSDVPDTQPSSYHHTVGAERRWLGDTGSPFFRADAVPAPAAQPAPAPAAPVGGVAGHGSHSRHRRGRGRERESRRGGAARGRSGEPGRRMHSPRRAVGVLPPPAPVSGGGARGGKDVGTTYKFAKVGGGNADESGRMSSPLLLLGLLLVAGLVVAASRLSTFTKATAGQDPSQVRDMRGLCQECMSL